MRINRRLRQWIYFLCAGNSHSDLIYVYNGLSMSGSAAAESMTEFFKAIGIG